MNNEKLIKSLQSLQRQSEAAWEGAVDTAGPEYEGGSEAQADKMQSLADSCDEAYDSAIEALRAGDLDTAREHLETAKSLESEGGDSSHARAALDEMMTHEQIKSTTIVASISDGMSRNAGGETRITADSYDDAVAEAEEWVRDGDYTSEDSDTVDVQLIIADTDDTILERRTVTAPACRAN